MKALKYLIQGMLKDGHEPEDLVTEVRAAIDELIGSVPEGEQPRFNYQELTDMNLDGIKETYNEGQLIGIIDESKGGFIGYAIGEEHAELMVKSLINTKGIFWEI